MSSILILAPNNDVHADAVLKALEKRNASVVRIDTEELHVSSNNLNFHIHNNCSCGYINYKDRKINFNDISAVYCRDFVFEDCAKDAPIDIQLKFCESKSAYTGFFRSLEGCYWMNAPWYDEMADNKPYQSFAAQRCGLNIPDTLISNKKDEFLSFYQQCNRQVIIKQLSEYCLIDDSEDKECHKTDYDPKVYGFYTKKVEEEHLQLLHEVSETPCLFQKLIDKKYDIRTTVVKDQLFSARIDSQTKESSKIDFRHELRLPTEPYSLPADIEKKLLCLLRKWNLEFAACDFVVDQNDDIIFIEANVEGNWLWLEHDLGLPISDAIAKTLIKQGALFRNE